jgi:hypothetical protein
MPVEIYFIYQLSISIIVDISREKFLSALDLRVLVSCANVLNIALQLYNSLPEPTRIFCCSLGAILMPSTSVLRVLCRLISCNVNRAVRFSIKETFGH